MAISRDLQATVLVPTHDHGPTLEYSVGSALRQTVDDIEVIVIGDGMPEHAREIALELERSDERVTLLDHPKGESRGEAYRHAVVSEARGQVVLYLSDDDLWFPDHVESLTATLAENEADFAHSAPLWRNPDGSFQRAVADLGEDRYRRLIAEGGNRVGLSLVAHTPDAYRRLPHGWRPAPPGWFTDAWMWQQFVDADGMRFACSGRITTLQLPSVDRKEMSSAQRLTELDQSAELIADPAAYAAILSGLLEADHEQMAWFEVHTWELTEWLDNREEAIAWHADEVRKREAQLAEARSSRRWTRFLSRP
jgi:hypothetical protein